MDDFDYNAVSWDTGDTTHHVNDPLFEEGGLEVGSSFADFQPPEVASPFSQHGDEPSTTDLTQPEIVPASATDAAQDPLAPAKMQISITQPHKEYEGTTAQHISYLITTQTELKTFPKSECQVRRRFQEFVWLYNTLVDEYPASMVPPLPGKHRMEYFKGDRFGEEFVEKRKDSLERFLQRVARHPTLQKSVCLRNFLTAEKLSTTAPKGEGALENLGEVLINAFTKVQKHDERFLEIKESVEKFSENLHTIERLHQKILKKQMELEPDYAALETEIKALSQLETRIAEPLLKFASAIEKQAEVTKEMIGSEEAGFLSQIHEYISYCTNVKGVMKLREQKQIDFEELSVLLDQQKSEREKLVNHGRTSGISSFLKGKYDEIKGVDQEKSRQQKLEKVEAKVKELEREVDSSGDLASRFSEEVLKEFAIFQTSKTIDLKDSFHNYCNSQMDYYKSGISIWEEIIPILEGIQPQ